MAGSSIEAAVSSRTMEHGQQGSEAGKRRSRRLVEAIREKIREEKIEGREPDGWISQVSKAKPGIPGCVWGVI